MTSPLAKVILADPPWPFATYSARGKGRSQEAYYDTMAVADIAALPVAELVADDSVLLLWVTSPILDQAFAVIRAWGFTYKTIGFTWVKLTKSSHGPAASTALRFHFGLGFWTRANAEVCLLATRGRPQRISRDVPALIVAPVREHSRKPDEVYDRIERLTAGPYLELFARQHRPDWAVAFSPEADSGPGKRRWAANSYPASVTGSPVEGVVMDHSPATSRPTDPAEARPAPNPTTCWAGIRAAMREAKSLGAMIYIIGNTIEIEGDLPAELLARLPWDALGAYLGAARLDQTEIDFLAALQVEAVLVEDEAGLAAAIADLDGADIIAIDIETCPPDYRPKPVRINKDGGVSASQPAPDMPGGLCPHRSLIQCLSLYAGPRNGADRAFVIRGPALALLLQGDGLAWLASRHLVCHSSAFELAFLMHHTGFKPTALPLECSYQASGLLHGAENRGLDDTSRNVLGLDPPKNKRVTLSAWNAKRLSPGQLAYCAADPTLTLLCWTDLEEQLKATGRWEVYCLQRDCAAVAAQMQIRGLPFNREKHKGITESWARELADLRHAFHDLTGEAPPSTPAELRAWVTANAGPRLAHWRLTPGGLLSTKFKHLKQLILADDPHVQAQTRLLLRLTSLTHLLQNFGPGLRQHIVPSTGRLHARYKVAAAKTGRIAAESPPLQQLPQKKAPEFKSCIEIDRPGYVLLGADFSQVELRAMAHLHSNEALTKVFAAGHDLHAMTAARLLGIPESEITKPQRDLAKAANFGSAYGISPRGLMENVLADYDRDLSEADAAKQLDNFFSTFPGLRSALEQRAREFQRQGYIEIGCGRVIRADWEIETRGHLTDQLCFNAPVQGICSDLMMRSMIAVSERLVGLDAGIVASVHDEIVCEVAEAEAAAIILQVAMIEAFEATFPGAPTVEVVKVAAGKNWAELKA